MPKPCVALQCFPYAAEVEGLSSRAGLLAAHPLPVPHLEQVSRDRNRLDIEVMAGSTVGCQAAWVFTFF